MEQKNCPRCDLPAIILDHEAEADCIRALKAKAILEEKKTERLKLDLKFYQAAYGS